MTKVSPGSSLSPRIPRPKSGAVLSNLALGLAFGFYQFVSWSLDGTNLLAIVLAGLILLGLGRGMAWWVSEQHRYDDSWITHLRVDVIRNYETDREDVEVAFAKRWARRPPWGPYVFGEETGSSLGDGKLVVTVSRRGDIAVSRRVTLNGQSAGRSIHTTTSIARKDAAVSSASSPFPRFALLLACFAFLAASRTRRVKASTAPPAQQPILALPVGPPFGQTSISTVILDSPPTATARSGETMQVGTIALVIALVTFVVVDGIWDTTFMTTLIGAIAAFLLALMGLLAAFGQADDEKALARWRAVAAADLVDQATDTGITLPDALALLHSDVDSRPKLRQWLTLARPLGGDFTCVRRGRTLVLKRSSSQGEWLIEASAGPRA